MRWRKESKLVTRILRALYLVSHNSSATQKPTLPALVDRFMNVLSTKPAQKNH